jgi:hypothetical protein
LRKKDAAASAPNPDDEELLFQLMKVSVEDFRKQQSLKHVPTRLAREQRANPKSIFPVPSKKTKTKTKVAACSGPGADLNILQDPTDCGWVEGFYKKYNPSDAAPYVIRWKTKPPVESAVNAATMKSLHANYFFCAQNEIFGGIVGREIFWVLR